FGDVGTSLRRVVAAPERTRHATRPLVDLRPHASDADHGPAVGRRRSRAARAPCGVAAGLPVRHARAGTPAIRSGRRGPVWRLLRVPAGRLLVRSQLLGRGAGPAASGPARRPALAGARVRDFFAPRGGGLLRGPVLVRQRYSG